MKDNYVDLQLEQTLGYCATQWFEMLSNTVYCKCCVRSIPW